MEIDLEQLKQVELEILLEVDRICRENNIRYQLFAGTLLGAVRHNGFIPWDDDIDICLLRKDYNKLIEICREKLDSKYFLQHYEDDKDSIYNFARIRKNNTLVLQESWGDLDMHKGIFIDVFPLDKVLPNKIIGKVQKYILHIIKRIKPLKVKRKAYNSRYRILKYIKILIHLSLKPLTLQRLNRIETKVACMFEDRETIYSSCLTDSNILNVYSDFMVENGDFYDIINLEFEGYYFPAPRNYHEVLTNNYGDYMTPPPVEQQKPHHGIIDVCFDTSKNQGGIANE